MKISKLRLLVITLLDYVVIHLSLMAGYLLRTDTLPKEVMPDVLINGLLIFVVFEIIMFFSKGYKSLWEYASMDEAIKLFLVCVNALLAGFFIMNFSEYFLPRSVYVIAGMIIFLSVSMIRFAYRVIRRLKKRIKGTVDNTLIVGDGYTLSYIIKFLRENDTPYRPVAILSKEKTLVGKRVNGIPIEGVLEDLASVMRKKKITTIILAENTFDPDEIRDVIKLASECKCKLKKYYSFDETEGDGKISEINTEDLLGRDPVVLDNERIKKHIQDKTVLISGGGGSIGSELCRQILSYQPKKLVVLDIYENSVFELEQELLLKNKHTQLEMVIGSVRDFARLKEIFKAHKPEMVFHAAAHKHVPLMEKNPREAIKNNVLGTRNMAEVAHLFEAKEFILISTDKAVCPTNIMGATKRIGEMIIQAYNQKSNTQYVAVRFGNVLGSNGSVVPLFMNQIKSGGPVTVTHPEVTRFFMTITEAVGLVIQSGIMADGGEIYILDMGKPVKIYDLAQSLIRMMGHEPDKDIEIKFTGLRPGEKLYEELLLDDEAKTTSHKKLFVAKPKEWDLDQLLASIEELSGLNDTKEIKRYLKQLVPEYHNGNTN